MLYVNKMGNIFDMFSSWVQGNREACILILGLDASGKTTIMNRLKYGDNRQTIPTIGFDVEHIKFGNLSFVGWDIGGQDNIRKMWHHYFENADAVVYVIDSNDRMRFKESRRELKRLSEHTYLKNCPFLIFANKQDLPNAVGTRELENKMNLYEFMRNVPEYKLCGSTATCGYGIDEGFQWLSDTV